MQPVLFDTSLWVAALRSNSPDRILSLRRTQHFTVWMSSVVLEELYAGGASEQRRAVERVEADFERVGRIVVPNLKDWTEAGKVLSQIAHKYGHEQIARARLTNDALIAMSAGRQGILIFAGNQKDFTRLAEFRPFRWSFSRSNFVEPIRVDRVSSVLLPSFISPR